MLPCGYDYRHVRGQDEAIGAFDALRSYSKYFCHNVVVFRMPSRLANVRYFKLIILLPYFGSKIHYLCSIETNKTHIYG